MFYEKVKFTEELWSPILKIIELFSDTFLVYELAYARVQLGLERFALERNFVGTITLIYVKVS